MPIIVRDERVTLNRIYNTLMSTLVDYDVLLEADNVNDDAKLRLTLSKLEVCTAMRFIENTTRYIPPVEVVE